ncbi:MAG: sigma-70 family RNA polymerase sigma factor [Gemmataceae bacterium]|nr:sigma-70 family RNA polymerase sigma factor [Gemmataceae bacterium]MCI0737978.1 sigma-70 family RNA polymerase sigma factor [Gemmataceae bacterium]
MSVKAAHNVLQSLRKVAGPRLQPSDSGLLARYVEDRDAAAFAGLLERHGPMVLGVCRRVLGNPADADDAFQATFFQLARNAAKIRRDGSVAGWLHAVAQRTAIKARARRKSHSALDENAKATADDPFGDIAWRELRGVLDEELSQLPERLRGPLVLCYLDGLTRDEAAQRLGWSLATLKRRLEEGRDLLRKRLAKRGLAPALLAIAVTSGTSLRAAVPETLRHVAAQSALHAAPVSASVQALLCSGNWLPRSLLGKLAMSVLLLSAVLAGAFSLSTAAKTDLPSADIEELHAPLADNPRVDRFGDPMPDGMVHRFGSERFRDASNMSNSSMSADGRLLAVGSWNGIAIFDLESGKKVHELRDSNMINSIGGMSRLAISPDGTRVAHLTSHYQAVLRDARSGKALHTFGEIPKWHTGFMPLNKRRQSTPADYLIATLFSADGKQWIAVGRSTLYFFDANGGVEIRRLDVPGYVLAVAPDRQRIAAVAKLNEQAIVAVCDMNSGKIIASIVNPEIQSDSQPMAFAPDGKTLAVVVEKSSVRLYDAETGQLKAKYEAPAPERTADGFKIESLAFTPNGATLFAGSYKGIFRWNTATGAMLPKLAGHLAWNVWGMHVTPDGKRLISVGSDCTIRRWDTATGAEIPLPDGYAWYTTVAYAPDGRTLAVADAGDRLDLWDPATGKLRKSSRVAGLENSSIAFTHDGRLLAAGHTDGAIRFWDAQTGEERKVLRSPAAKGRVTLLAFSPDGKWMLSHASKAPLHLWDLATDQTIWEASSVEIRHTLFSPDGKTIALGDEKKAITLLETATGKELRRIPAPMANDKETASLTGMTFSTDSQTLTTDHSDGLLRVWEIATGKLRTQRTAVTGWEVSFSADGRWYAVADNKNTVHIGETATGKETRQLHHDALVIHVAFSPDGRNVLTATRANAYLWTLSPQTADNVDAAALWADLSGIDAAKANRALWTLIDQPELACKVLKAKIGGPVSFDVKEAQRWIQQLDSKVFAERDSATRALAARGRLVERMLREALAGAKSLEFTRRIEGLLQAITPEPTAEEVARDRALKVVEMIGNDEARAALQNWATGAAGAALTQDAQAALRRLEVLRR